MSRKSRLITWWWVLFWLIFLVNPVATHITQPGGRRLGAGCLLLGAVIYALTVRASLGRIMRGGLATDGVHPAFVGALALSVTGLMLAAGALIGSDGFALLPYAAVMVALGMRFPSGLVWAVCLTIASYAVSASITGTRLDMGITISAMASAVAASLGSYSAGRNEAARRAEAEAHDLRIQEERNRMARDLHDVLGHSLTAITVKAELAGKLVDVDATAAKAQIQELERLSRAALADVRRTVSGYREISLAGELVRARTSLQDAGIRAVLPGNVDEVEPDVRVLFAWAIREGVTNVLRHSGAGRCVVTLEPHRLTMTDDGRGPEHLVEGNGLAGLRERARQVGAEVEIADAHPGLRMSVFLPELPEAASASTVGEMKENG